MGNEALRAASLLSQKRQGSVAALQDGARAPHKVNSSCILNKKLRNSHAIPLLPSLF